MHSEYVVGFKDVYPWIWSVMLGVGWALAERRGAFLPDRNSPTTSVSHGWAKAFVGVLLNVLLPAIVFGLTMVRLGPLYSANMGFWEVVGALYLAGTPMGSHHLWLVVAKSRGWLSDEYLRVEEKAEANAGVMVHVLWSVVPLVIPAVAAIIPFRLPWWG